MTETNESKQSLGAQEGRPKEMITIERIKNGWTVQNGIETEAFLEIQSLFDHLLLVLEGKSEHFGGSLYGKVRVVTKKPQDNG